MLNVLVKFGIEPLLVKLAVVEGGKPLAARFTLKAQPPFSVTFRVNCGSGSVAAHTLTSAGVGAMTKPKRHSSKRKEATRVPQLEPGMYSLVNQKVQSSAGSTLREA